MREDFPTAPKHECAHPYCKAQIPRSMLACRTHWSQLPKRIQGNIWATYRPRQEETGQISEAYVHAFQEARAYWLKVHKRERPLI